MGASIDIVAIAEGEPFEVERCQVRARTNPHGRSGAMAFRIEDEGRVVVYASDAGYGAGGPPAASLELYRGADVLIHDSTYTPEDGRRYADRGFSSVEDAVGAADRGGRQAAGAVPLRPGLQRRPRSTRCARAAAGCSTNAAGATSSSSVPSKARR